MLSAVHAHKVLLFKDVRWSQFEMVQWFGALGVPLPQRGREVVRGECDEIFVLSDHGEASESPFLSSAALELHSDLSYRQQPGTLSLLHAVVVPWRGGETTFVDTAAVFAALPSALRAHLRSLRARHRQSSWWSKAEE